MWAGCGQWAVYTSNTTRKHGGLADRATTGLVVTNIGGAIPSRGIPSIPFTQQCYIGIGANVTNIGGAIPPCDISSIPFILQCYT